MVSDITTDFCALNAAKYKQPSMLIDYLKFL